MKKVLIFAFVVMVAGTAFGMGDLYVSGTWRYRMTVEIETPEEIKTGSAVHELSNANSSVEIMSFPEAGNPPTFKGEAVAVDMGARGVVFAILPTDPYYMFFYTFYPALAGATTVEGIKFFNSLPSGLKKDLPPKHYPPFVMFKDMDDPKTVTAVDTTKFAETFGEGVRFKSITLEITDEKVTWGIINKYLSDNFWDRFRAWMQSIDIYERGPYVGLFNFKAGEP